MEQVKTGLGGATGNKGTVAISFSYAASSFCFLSSHFAAGQKEVQDRNNDYTEAVKKLKFTNVSLTFLRLFGFIDHFPYRVEAFQHMIMYFGVETSIIELIWTDQKLLILLTKRLVVIT